MTVLPNTDSLDVASRGGPASGLVNLVSGPNVASALLDVASRGGPATMLQPLRGGGPPPATMSIVTPARLIANSSQTVTIQGSGSSWVNGSTTFSASGVTGAAVTATAIDNTTQVATLTVTTSTGGAIGTITFADSLDAATTTLAVTAVATAYTVTGPSQIPLSGATDTNFTATLSPSGAAFSENVTVTPSDGGAGGTFTPTTFLLSRDVNSASTTFTYTGPATAQSITLSFTNDRGLSNPASLSVQSVIFVPKLRAYWKMEEATGLSRLDSVGSLPLLDYSGNVVQASGKHGQAALFALTGVTNLHAVSDPAIQLGGGKTWAVTVWVKWTSFDPTFPQQIAGKMSGGISQLNEFYLWSSGTGTRIVQINIGDGVVGGNNSIATQTITGATTGTWYFIRAWYDGSLVHLQINNGAVTDATQTAVSWSGTNDLWVGGITGSHNFHDGAIDDLAMWRPALTDAEATTLYNSGSGLDYADILTGGVISRPRRASLSGGFAALTGGI